MESEFLVKDEDVLMEEEEVVVCVNIGVSPVAIGTYEAMVL